MIALNRITFNNLKSLPMEFLPLKVAMEKELDGFNWDDVFSKIMELRQTSWKKAPLLDFVAQWYWITTCLQFVEKKTCQQAFFKELLVPLKIYKPWFQPVNQWNSIIGSFHTRVEVSFRYKFFRANFVSKISINTLCWIIIVRFNWLFYCISTFFVVWSEYWL